MNISTVELLKAYGVYVCRLLTSHIVALIRYRHIYQNYVNVLCRILRNEYPIEAIYRKGNSILLRNRLEASIGTRLAYLGCYKYKIADNKVTIYSYSFDTDKKRKVELYDALSNGELFEIFFDKIYDFLPVHGKTVIDIGANIGDSCVYFALRGSSKIIAIEPFPRNYKFAKENIDVNGFTDRITLQLAGCGPESREITIDPLYKSNDRSSLLEFKQGIKIPLFTLRDILMDNNVSRGEVVLKMDCEGCEYDTILSSTPDTLRFFSHIQLEYHLGYKNLKEKLEKCGFHVSITKPLFDPSTSIAGRTILYTGYLCASQLEESE
jgi:FkbM family methyltransferase